MRLLVLNWQDRLDPRAGGAETHLHEIFGRLAARGHQIVLLVSRPSGAVRRATVDGMEVHRVGGRYTFNLVAPAYYRRRLTDREFDVMVEDLNKVPLLSPLWARHPLALLVHHLFGATAFQEATAPVAAATWLLERPLGPLYRRVPTMAVSRSTARDLGERGLEEDRIVVIPNGVEVARLTPDKDVARFGQPTLLYLGRVKRYKRIDLPIRVVAALRSQGIEVRLIVAGTGDHADALRGLAAELGVADAVDFHGYVTEEAKIELFRRAWIHVLTSPKEGWGITNLEAAACGTPTIASDSPGLRDSVVHGETGFLVPHGDVGALAERVRALVGDEELRGMLGQKARAFAERFTWDRAADETEAFLAGVAVSV
ncbi:MAG TPA: glycosyltransferase family 4 protein [Longimicrobiales bacterium]|nr:glycosyltransferase family 4 protein [Longimicrobiales bacterium]